MVQREASSVAASKVSTKSARGFDHDRKSLRMASPRRCTETCEQGGMFAWTETRLWSPNFASAMLTLTLAWPNTWGGMRVYDAKISSPRSLHTLAKNSARLSPPLKLALA